MIVTCESCKSRYKLDDAKITGRGAKITCPKCKAVFVVYAQPTPPQAPAVKVPEPVAPKPEPAQSTPPSPRQDTWDDEPTRVGDTLMPPDPPRADPPAPSAEAPKPAVSKDPALVASRAAALDFRKVGVVMWKVKVKIGLIYDFSDIKTLRKYIQDGRVTSTDVISWDGKSWRAIGDIPDLDSFFVETYDMLAERREAAPPELPAPAPTPAPTPDSRTVVDATDSRTGGEPNQFQDPFAESRRKAKERSEKTRPAPPPPPTAAPNRTPLLVGLVVLLLLGVGGAWWWQQQQKPVTTPGTPNVGSVAPTSSPDDIKKKLEEDLRRNLEEHPAEPVPSTGPSSTGLPKNPEELTVRTPPGTPVIPDGATARQPRTGPSSTSPTIKQADQTPSDHEAVGDDAASSGDWSTAVQAYQTAVGLDGKSARLRSKLGRAQLEAGDTAAAQGTLQKAAQMGSKDAHKYLGHIAKSQGDTPGATFEYQEYLKSSPKDAAEIKQILAQLSGG